VAGGAERRGLRVVSCDVLEYLREQPDESWGAVVALHLLEHLAPAELQQCLAEVRRVLRPGGLLAAECPNPYSLRVGGTLFWIDPTHRRPLLPDTLELFMLAAGLQPEAPHWRHPFPEEQRLMPSLPEGESPEMVQLCGAVGELADRLDELLNGYRDYVLVAHRPEAVEVERNASEARSTGRTL
jgi:O-antigen chain-terminating methyltransferase